MDSHPEIKGRPLQIVKLKKTCVRVDDNVLEHISKRLKEVGAQKVAVVSVMGAFRTGKSFLLNLFLRYLRYEEYCRANDNDPEDCAQGPERTSHEAYALPAWLTSAGMKMEGITREDGFRFKGGMDTCTEGIWVWSEPFVRVSGGEKVAVLLFDTQGAWDSALSKEQSATIFGITAALSSKLIYNINKQIQQDKIENLAYFVQFAKAAIHQACDEMQSIDPAELDRPFQALDFLVRDWQNFHKTWTTKQCMDQMQDHVERQMKPEHGAGAADLLASMFQHIDCRCLPHPDFAIEASAWNGAVHDISTDFVRFIDIYVREVFGSALKPKRIFGHDLSPSSFAEVFRNFAKSFEGCAPAAMTFTQAITNYTVLLAREQSMKSYRDRMDAVMRQNSGGLDKRSLSQIIEETEQKVQEDYDNSIVFGSKLKRSQTWDSIQEDLHEQREKYFAENARRLEKVLAGFAHVAIIAFSLFGLDRISDFACDWWSETCRGLSKLMLLAYMGIFMYLGHQTYLLVHEQGRLSAAIAIAELGKEMLQISGTYIDFMSSGRKITAGKIDEVTHAQRQESRNEK